jgi:hypothetical protein
VEECSDFNIFPDNGKVYGDSKAKFKFFLSVFGNVLAAFQVEQKLKKGKTLLFC